MSIAVADKREEALSASAAAVSLIRIDLETDNNETRSFLSAPLDTEFPPSAYDLSGWGESGELEDFQPDFSMQYKESAVPFPDQALLEQKDWNLLPLGKALEECVSAMPALKAEEGAEWTLFAKHFWHALVRGGIQGALWYIRRNNEVH